MSAAVFASPANAEQPDHDARYTSAPQAQPYYAAPDRRQKRPQANQWVQRKISAAEAKSIARRRVRGAQVVDISLNGNTYRVRMLKQDGRVVDVLIDAVTGRAR